MITKRLILAGLLSSSALLLQSCSSTSGGFFDNEGGFWGSRSESYSSDQARYRGHRPVVVNPGYHLADRKSPKTHKERDMNWVDQQNSEDFTIEVANDQKASTVAKALHKSPKNHRAAQFKYKKDDQTRYRGVYGTYKSKQEADAALAKLPESVRNSAKVKNWGSVKSNAVKEESKPSFSRPAPASVGTPPSGAAEY